MNVRWGILGAAGINDAMAPAITAASNAELVAIASRTQQRAEAAASKFSVPRAIAGYDVLIADPEIDAIYIPLPNSLHAEWTMKALLAGKHVLCEKPMTVTADEARAVAQASSATNRLVQEAYMYARHPRYDMIAELIRSGSIGDVRVIITTFSFDASEELDHSGFQGMPGSGAIYDVGGYAVHSARLLLGREPIAVTASATISALHGDIDLTTSGLVEFEGATLLFHVGMAGADIDTLEIIGSRGRIMVPHAFICAPEDGDFLVTVGEVTTTVEVPLVNHYVAQVEAFSAAVLAGSPKPEWGADQIAGAAVLEALTNSVRKNVRVEL